MAKYVTVAVLFLSLLTLYPCCKTAGDLDEGANLAVTRRVGEENSPEAFGLIQALKQSFIQKLMAVSQSVVVEGKFHLP